MLNALWLLYVSQILNPYKNPGSASAAYTPTPHTPNCKTLISKKINKKREKKTLLEK